MARFGLLEGGLFLAGLAESCVQFACSPQANGRKAQVLCIFTSIILLTEVLTFLGQYLMALSRNNLMTGTLSAATVRILFPF